MHKCPNCGQEFEGKFCSTCGAQWQEEKTCPKCGAKNSGSSRFCNECGYSFTRAANADTPPKEKHPSQIKQKLSVAFAWIKSHLKIVIPVAVGLVVVIILLSLIPTFIAMKTNGTYYKYRGGKFDEETYFTLSGGKWTDEDGETGTYKINGENIIFYGEFFGSIEELASGTISNGVLSLDTGGANKDIYVKKNHKHKYGEWQTIREVDCVTDGLKTHTCACGDTERDETPRWGHSGEWTILQEATCTEEGSKKINCIVCGNEQTESIEKLPHNYSEWAETKVATCTEEGLNTRICATCQEEETETIEKLPHTFNEWTEIKAANCTEEGTNTRACKVCNKEETQSIEKTPHNYDTKYNYDTESHWRECSVCGNKVEIAEHIGEGKCTICSFPLTYTEGLQITLNSEQNGYTVSGIGSVCETIIRIPSTYNGLPVTSIGESAFLDCTSLDSIIIPDSVAFIDSSAFKGCSSIRTITIPNSIVYIKENAFDNCNNLRFNKCDNSFYLGNDSNPYLVLIKAILNNITSCSINENTKIIMGYAFYKCTSLTSVIIPNSVTYIGRGAFEDCSYLENIIIPEKVTSIIDWTFGNCVSLKSITIPDGVTSIGEGAFAYCSSLTDIIIPVSVTSIGGYAFWNSKANYRTTFKGTKTQWYAIQRGIRLFNDSYQIHCTDGDVQVWQ